MFKIPRVLILIVTLTAFLFLASPAKAQFLNGQPGQDMLTPEIMASQPRLSEQDITLFVDLFTHILAIGGQLADINMFSRTRGVDMLRLNYITVKITFNFIPNSSREAIVRELGLGVLPDDQEKALIEKHLDQLNPIMDVFKES
ncbi:MAG: hypothetical protein LBE31_04620 [Deltaproteobacteria bacterium]|nr:hypothetical protein [Deltaproteobacteria bacterium]